MRPFCAPFRPSGSDISGLHVTSCVMRVSCMQYAPSSSHRPSRAIATASSPLPVLPCSPLAASSALSENPRPMHRRVASYTSTSLSIHPATRAMSTPQERAMNGTSNRTPLKAHSVPALSSSSINSSRESPLAKMKVCAISASGSYAHAHVMACTEGSSPSVSMSNASIPRLVCCSVFGRAFCIKRPVPVPRCVVRPFVAAVMMQHVPSCYVCCDRRITHVRRKHSVSCALLDSIAPRCISRSALGSILEVLRRIAASSLLTGICFCPFLVRMAAGCSMYVVVFFVLWHTPQAVFPFFCH